MSQPLVVLTYPGHFMTTALTIRSYFFHNEPVPVTVIADDISRFAWPSYITDCEHFYAGLADSVTVIPVSTLPQAQYYNQPHNGWLRQQLVKLYLDKIIDLTECFFTDGDMQFQFPVPRDSVPFTITNNPRDTVRARQNAYVSQMLQITNPGIVATHPHMDFAPNCQAQVCVSNPPFRTMRAQTLKQLRQHIWDLRGQTIEQSHAWMYDTCEYLPNGDAPFLESEWELIENFRVHVLGEDINPVYYPAVPMSATGHYPSIGMEFCVTTYVSDRGLGRAWFQQHDLAVSDQVWQHLAQIVK